MERCGSRWLPALVLFSSTVLLGFGAQNINQSELRAPAGSLPTRIDPTGRTVLPNGRFITPSGVQVRVAPHPYGLTISPDGKTVVTANSGTAPFSASILTQLDSPQPLVVQIPPGYKAPDADPKSVYMGVAIAPDNRTLYLSEGDNGCVGIFDLVTHRRLDSMSLDGTFEGATYKDSLPGDLKLSPGGKWLYVLDLAHFRLVIFDTESKHMVASVPVGFLPFALALSPDGDRAYVTNVGMFQYSLVPGYDPKRALETGLSFPPFGFPSPEARDGVEVEGKAIPGLGDPNSSKSNSLWVLDVLGDAPQVIAKIRTGLPVGPESFGGSSPGGVVAGRERVFVSNAAQDSISIIDAKTKEVEQTVLLEPAPSVRGLRGVLPFGMALSPDEETLYVACAGINAVAVLDTKEAKVLGYIPTAWFPARVEISPDGKTLYVSNTKGYGAGPNGGPNFHLGPEGTYIGDITKGIVSVIPLPWAPSGGWRDWADHADFWPPWLRGTEKISSALLIGTEMTMFNNGFVVPFTQKKRRSSFPIPPPGQPSRLIHHVVFIVRENRTFDQDLGDLTNVGRGQAERDPELASFGDDALVVEEKDEVKAGQTPKEVEHARVTPNLHALARRFAFSDNYYVDSDVSVDGHHWLVGNYPNEWTESVWPANYGDEFRFLPDADAPGRLMIGSTTPRPEDYIQAGSLWENLARNHITFRNYGEGFDLPGETEDEGMAPTGVREVINMPMEEPVFENTSRTYPMFNTSIPDQYRVQQFKKEFEERYVSGKEALPQFIYIWLPDDHTAKPRPKDGYPFRASYVADNDLALGKLIELFSHSPFWKDTAIFVTEDDAQDGRDHVDAHRSVLVVISPYARRGVSHVHTSMQSILKTFDLILKMPYLNQYDAAATDLSDMFTSRPDFAPYNALPSDTRVFDPAEAAMPSQDLAAHPLPPSAPLDDPATIRREMRERQNHDR